MESPVTSLASRVSSSYYRIEPKHSKVDSFAKKSNAKITRVKIFLTRLCRTSTRTLKR